MTLNHVKLGRVTFIKYLASVFSFIFLALALISNKTTFSAKKTLNLARQCNVKNTLNLAQLVVNEPMNSIYKKFYQYSLFCSIYHGLM